MNNVIDQVKTRLDKMRLRSLEFSQCRSSFQIEKFIGLDEHTPITRYRHLAHNSFMTLKAAKDAYIEKEKVSRALKRLEKKEKSLLRKIKILFGYDDDLDLEKAQLCERLDDIEIQIKGALEEVEVFEKLCDELERQNGKPFTKEQLEAEEPIRWQKQLITQANQILLSRNTGIDIGNLNAINQACEKPILSDSKNIIAPFQISNNGIKSLEQGK